MYEKYRALSWKKKVLIGVGLTLASGVGFTVGGVAGGAILGVSGLARAVTGGFAAYSAYTGVKGFAEQAPNPSHGIFRRNLHKLLSKNPKLYALLAGVTSFTLVGRSLSHWGEVGKAALNTLGNIIGINSDHVTGAVQNDATYETTQVGVVAKYMQSHIENVDYAKIWDPQIPVMFVGEMHTILSDKDEIIRNLPLFKRMGMTHLALDSWGPSDQKMIDDYFSGTISWQQFVDAFADPRQGTIGVGATKYLELIATCKKLHIKVIGLEPTDYSTLSSAEERNYGWIKILSGIFKKDHSARILALAGQAHLGYNPSGDTVNELLASRYGISSVVVDLDGGLKADVLPNLDYTHAPNGMSSAEAQRVMALTLRMKEVGEAARILHIDQERFEVPVDRTSWRYPIADADYVIHLPETQTVVPEE